jgi:hypothetical protein
MNDFQRASSSYKLLTLKTLFLKIVQMSPYKTGLTTHYYCNAATVVEYSDRYIENYYSYDNRNYHAITNKADCIIVIFNGNSR